MLAYGTGRQTIPKDKSMDEIKKIIERYLADKDYEKALSLLKNLPDNAECVSLMEICEKGFIEECTAQIAHFAQIKDKESAEKVIEKYMSLIGQDANVTLWKTLINNLQMSPRTSTIPNVTGASSWENNIREFITDFKIDTDAQRAMHSKWMKNVVIVLLGMSLLFGVIPNISFKYFMCLSVVSIAVILAIVTLKTKGILPKLAASILILVPTVKCILIYLFSSTKNVDNINMFADSSIIQDLLTVYFYSFGFIALYNLLLPQVIKIRKRLIFSVLLLTLLNPLFWGIKLMGGIVEYIVYSYTTHCYYYFNETYKFFIFIAATSSYLLLYQTLTGAKWNTDKIKLWIVRLFGVVKIYTKKILALIVNNRKPIIISVSVILLLLVGIGGYSHHNKMLAEEAEKQAAIVKAHNDSIAAVKRAKIKTEKRRLAAIAQARRDSIRAVEQARQDSIDRVEHAAFAKKYSNIGLIITDVKMTRGKDKDGDRTKGLDFAIFNPTKKKIKYVVASMVAINGVGDVMSYEKICRGIGPVDSYHYGSWSFDDVFHDPNDVIDDLRVYFRVIYTNGTSKTVRVKDALYNGYFEYDWFE